MNPLRKDSCSIKCVFTIFRYAASSQHHWIPGIVQILPHPFTSSQHILSPAALSKDGSQCSEEIRITFIWIFSNIEFQRYWHWFIVIRWSDEFDWHGQCFGLETTFLRICDILDPVCKAICVIVGPCSIQPSVYKLLLTQTPFLWLTIKLS